MLYLNVIWLSEYIVRLYLTFLYSYFLKSVLHNVIWYIVSLSNKNKSRLSNKKPIQVYGFKLLIIIMFNKQLLFQTTF